MKDKERMSCFFEKTFLLADISMDITLCMPFPSLSNIEINFVDCHIDQKLYVIIKVFLTTMQVKLIGKKKFAAVVLDPEDKAFVVYITFINLDSNVHPF